MDYTNYDQRAFKSRDDWERVQKYVALACTLLPLRCNEL
jgi:hypothetical protein